MNSPMISSLKAHKIDRRSVVRFFLLGAIILSMGLFIGFSREVISDVSNLYPGDLPAQPYFILQHAVLLYVVTPLVVLAAIILLLIPGIFFVLANAQISGLGDLVLKGFGTSFLLHFCARVGFQLVFQSSMTAHMFFLITVGLVLLSWILLGIRVLQGSRVLEAFLLSIDGRRILLAMAIPMVIVVFLLPSFFWQNFSGDGWETFEIGRSLSTHLIPQFPASAVYKGLGAGMIPMAYPVHWFIMLFGPVEAAARLPLVLYLPVLFVGLLGLIEWKLSRQLQPLEELALVLSLFCYAVAMCFSASYNHYLADVASPSAIETLTVLFMLGVAYFLWTEQRAWFFLFSILGYLARPTGMLFLGLLGLGIVLSGQKGRRSQLLNIGIAIVLCLLINVLYEKVLIQLFADENIAGYASASLLKRFQYLNFFDFWRFVYVAVPAGILPALCLFVFWKQDAVARSLAIACLLYFGIFFVQAFISLHHFVPVMILPLVVFWRVILSMEYRWWGACSIILVAAFSLWISLPQVLNVNRTWKEIGHKTLFKLGNYRGSYPDYRKTINNQELLVSLFRPDWEVDDPSKELVGSPGVHLYYSSKVATPESEVNYLVQSISEPAPLGFTLVDKNKEGAVFVRDMEMWNHDRFQDLRTDFASSLYQISPETMHKFLGVPAKNYTINLKDVVCHFAEHLAFCKS